MEQLTYEKGCDCVACEEARDMGGRELGNGMHYPFRQAMTPEKLERLFAGPPTFENVKRALEAGARFEDVAPVGVSRADFEADAIRRSLRDAWIRNTGEEPGETSKLLFNAIAESVGAQIAALQNQLDLLRRPAFKAPSLLSLEEAKALKREWLQAWPDVVTGINPPDATEPRRNPLGRLSVAEKIAAAAQRVAPLIQQIKLPGQVQEIKVDGRIDLGPACDCGAEKCKTTHADWCSAKAGA